MKKLLLLLSLIFLVSINVFSQESSSTRILFENNSHEISATEAEKLTTFWNAIEQSVIISIQLDGHTDNVGENYLYTRTRRSQLNKRT